MFGAFRIRSRAHRELHPVLGTVMRLSELNRGAPRHQGFGYRAYLIYFSKQQTPKLRFKFDGSLNPKPETFLALVKPLTPQPVVSSLGTSKINSLPDLGT